MAGRKHGIDTDPFDKETRDAMDEFADSQISADWSYAELNKKYMLLKDTTQKNFPNLWPALEFALAVKTILNLKGVTLPFIGTLLGPPSSTKTVAVDMFKGYNHTFYTDHFSPRAFVSHNSGMKETQLKKIDLLPKLRNRYFLTPELSPMFSVKDDDLNQVIGLLTRIADGEGYHNDTGAQGHRGYDCDMMFTWLGAAVDIPYKVHKLLSSLGPKLYFFRLPKTQLTEDYYFDTKDDDFHSKKGEVKNRLFEYLYYFEMNPHIELEEESESDRVQWNGFGHGDGNGKDKDDDESKNYHLNDDGPLPKIAMHTENDDDQAHRIIIKLCLMLSHLRASVPVWDSHNQGSDTYNYTIPKIEEPDRAMQQMRTLAHARALSQGRTSITMDDIPLIIHTVLSTATMERVRLFDLLIEYKGELSTSAMCMSLGISEPTARKTMTELFVTGLVEDITGYKSNSEMRVRLKPEFEWFLETEFKTLKEQMFEGLKVLKEKYPPHTRIKKSNMGTNENNTENKEQDSSSNNEIKPIEISTSDRNEHMRGGEKPFSTLEEELNGGNYERKGMTGNVFRCLDCEMENFQYIIENHKCVAWPEKKQQPQQQEQTKVKSDSGKWLLDK